MVEPSELAGDCDRCVGLCCVALPFAASSDFGHDKPAGVPCDNLLADHRCGIHDRLSVNGYRGCVAYDCFGAGQKVTRTTFAGRDRRDDPSLVARMTAVFPVVRQLHEMLRHLHEALGVARQHVPAAVPEAESLLSRTDALTRLGEADLLALDVAGHRVGVGDLLARVSVAARERSEGEVRGRRGRGRGADGYRDADLIGRSLRGADLARADLRGSRLIGADLTGADLRGADLLGADLRGADLTDADLTGALFVTQPQLEAARGSARTTLPGSATRPHHWSDRPVDRAAQP